MNGHRIDLDKSWEQQLIRGINLLSCDEQIFVFTCAQVIPLQLKAGQYVRNWGYHVKTLTRLFCGVKVRVGTASHFEITLAVSYSVGVLIPRTHRRGHPVNQMQSGTIFDKRVTRLQDGGKMKKHILLSDSEANLKLQPTPRVAQPL